MKITTSKMLNKSPKNIFIDGAITAAFIAEQIQKHSTKKNIGAHSIFLGQVRNDIVDEHEINAIEYTSYEAMAMQKMREIRE